MNITEKDYKMAAVRGMMLDAVRRELIGPLSENEIISDYPTNAYVTGLLFPKDSENEDDSDDEDFEGEKEFDEVDQFSDEEANESDSFEEDDSKGNKAKFKKPSSLGVSFYLPLDQNKLRVDVAYGRYQRVDDNAVSDDTNDGDKAKKPKATYQRYQHRETLNIDFSGSRTGKIDLKESASYLYYVWMPIEKAAMVTVYLYNNAPRLSGDREYENVLFQVELKAYAPDRSPIFIPEYLCRKDLEDEYLYRCRPVYARGRGCAAVWKKEEDEVNAYSIRSAFIPDYEIPGVSTELSEMDGNSFSMLGFGSSNQKIQTINQLIVMTNQYEEWINNEIVQSSEMKDSSFATKSGKKIYQECTQALTRMRDGIKLLQEDSKVFAAFTDMNAAMYYQRSIGRYSNDHSKDPDVKIMDYMKTDHSHWRPFQIAFVLMNLKGIADASSLDREIVDLLYFPTGGGKTEAYLGLIAFTIALRRMRHNPMCLDGYARDGGVTAFLRYTLRLLTTQQRDRLTRLIIALELLRGKFNLGSAPISIGFWVGGNLTPNKFTDFDQKDMGKYNDAVRKVTGQVINCPYCGTKIVKDNYEISVEEKAVKIFCPDTGCKFHNRPLPIYLVDEEIYAKCPTVVISTVDKYARLPWSEDVGLLFGRTDRYCPRHGYQAIGSTAELVGARHNAKGNLPKCEVAECRPFYPPELIIQDELHLITGPLGTIYGGYETVVEEMCCATVDGKKIHPKYVVSTATIKNANEQVKCLYARKRMAQFPPAGITVKDSFFMREIPLPKDRVSFDDAEGINACINRAEKPFRLYAGVCAAGQSVKTTLIRVYAALLNESFVLGSDPEFAPYVDPYYTLIGYYNSLRELGGAKRLLDDDVKSRLGFLKTKYGQAKQRFATSNREITSRIPAWEIPKVLEELANVFKPGEAKQNCYDVCLATNMIAVGMDVDRLGLMVVTGQPKQNAEYIQATSRVGRMYPGFVITVYNPYRPRDLSNYENFVGLHSQLYRYVEGTTATPFAARARDRFLHALVIALLRLKDENMASNEKAKDIVNLSAEEQEELKKIILEKVAIIEPSAKEATSQDIDRFIETWKELSDKDKDMELRYWLFGKNERYRRLMVMYGDPYAKKDEIKTLNSMRDVESSSTLYHYVEEV